MPSAVLAQAPSAAVRQQVLRAVVQVQASDCSDGTRRVGSGFLYESPGRVVTAHHVVGGCKRIQVTYEGVAAPARRVYEASVARVYSAGDLGLLEVATPPALPVLRVSNTAMASDATYAGFGYPLGVPTAGDQPVMMAVGANRLRDILPDEAANELARSGSRIATQSQVLRLNVALQPGMSGGPIVDATGELVGVVAGGLKSGAAPVSWAWPRESLRVLLASTEPVGQNVALARIQYSSAELEQLANAKRDGRRLTCGELEFFDAGVRTLADLMRGADDFQRAQHLVGISHEDPQLLQQAHFRVWVHAGSGATAVVPVGYDLVRDQSACVARSTTGPFQLLIWGADTPTAADVQWRSQEFEQRVIGPRMPYQFGFLPDPNLTTYVLQSGIPIPGPQFRPNGLVFNRKGFALLKAPIRHQGETVPLAHAFHTLVAQSSRFLGVASLNDEIDAGLQQCLMQRQLGTASCSRQRAHLREWTRFVLATQLSTFPAL